MSRAPSIGFVSLGCPKNLVDSERILTQLRSEGYQLTDRYPAADLVIVNTCGFIDDAVIESLDTIARALDENGRVIVTGCLGKRKSLITEQYPQVLAVTGPDAYEEVMRAVHEHLPPVRDAVIPPLITEHIKLTPKHYAYLKIAEGCNQACTFCIIPQLRGPLNSRPIGEVLEEAERLVESGVRELLVISQDTGAYGIDLKYKTDFYQAKPLQSRIQTLVKELAQLGIWVRLHYLYPYPHIDELVALMAEGLILPYLDSPLQHASASVLKSMKRPAATEKMLKRIHKWRDICPEITLRSTFIVGFPGETEDDFKRLLDFLEEARLDRVGCFAYSNINGAPANAYANQVPEEIREQRLHDFMHKQQQISTDKLTDKIGSQQIVLVDEVHHDHFIARSKADAPEIDGEVIVSDAWDIEPGDFVEVEITDADAHDLFAEVVN